MSSLIRATIHTSIGSHIVKTTIEIADDLFERAQEIARKEETTFRALAEQGLRLVLRQKQARAKMRKWKPPTRGGGLNPEFRDWNWSKIRDLIYEGR